jgi:hypothetical protein
MRRNLKALGTALVAVFAMSAMTASAASAEPLFHSEIEDTFLTGSQGPIVANIFTTDLGQLKCEFVKFKGTWGQTTNTTLTLKPVYENCTMAEENAVVTENGCAFLFHLGNNTETLAASMDIECPDGQRIEIHIPECTTTLPPQAGLQQSKFTNEGEGTTRAIVADLELGEIHYVEHGPACPNQTVTTENGTYTGRITVKGENQALEHVGIWVD